MRRRQAGPAAFCPALAAAFLLTLSPDICAGEIGGFIKGVLLYVDDASAGNPELEDSFFSGAGRGRLDVKDDWGPIHVEVAPEVRISIAPREMLSSDFVAFGGRLNQGLLDLSRDFWEEGDVLSSLTLDRLWAAYTREDIQVSVGRQPIGFGASLFWSPTDLVTPFSPGELDRETRPGTDAVRVLWSPGRFTQFGFLWAPGRELEGNTALAQGRFPAGAAEATFIAGWVKERGAVGGTLTGETRGIGLRFDGSLLEVRRADGEKSRRSFRVEASGGFDYRFHDGIYLAAEYFHNGAGTSKRDDYAALAMEEPFTLGLVPFLGRHYLFTRVSKQLHPLVEGSLTVYWNLSDASVLFWPSASVSLSDNLEGVVFLFVPAGPGDTEFGSSPRALGAWLTLHY